MRSYDFKPGIPAAGHVTCNGYWHPGASGNCHKQPCIKDHCKHERIAANRGRCHDCGELRK